MFLVIYIERYRSLAPMYYRGAAAAIVVYDITKKVRYIVKTSSSFVQLTTPHVLLPRTRLMEQSHG